MPTRHPKYKTKRCRAFHTKGICRYGPRCHFIHSAGDHSRDLIQTNLIKPPLSLTERTKSPEKVGSSRRNTFRFTVQDRFSILEERSTQEDRNSPIRSAVLYDPSQSQNQSQSLSQNQNQSPSQNSPEASDNNNNNSENLYDFVFASTGKEIEYFDDVSFKGNNKIPKSCPESSRSPNPKRREIKSQPL